MTTKNIIVSIVILLAAVGLIYAAVRSSNKPYTADSSQSQPSQSQNAPASQQNTINQTQTGSQNQVAAGCPNGQDIKSMDANGRFKPTIDLANKVAVLNTSMGTITIQLYGQDAPKTVENFVCLIEKNYYNGTIFHRVAHGFVIQGGDPTGTGTGGKSIYGVPFQDELYSDTASFQAGYLKGVLAMANSGPNTNGSQFFILLADHPELQHAYTIFGKVISGQDVVDKIGQLSVTPVFGPDDGTPTTKVTINSASITTK